MSRRKLDIRRAKNQQLAERDAKARCAACKAPLPKIGAVVLLLDLEKRKFCSGDCAEDFTAAGKSKMGRVGR